MPARRATKVLPVEALRESTPGAEKPSWKRGVIGLAVLGAGTAGLLSALYGDAGMKAFGLGLLAAIVGVIIALPLAVRPLAALDRRHRSGSAGCPASWPRRTRRATHVVPPPPRPR